MTDWGAWVALGVGMATLGAAFIGTAIKLTWWLGAKFDDITNALNDHELKDEERQSEVLQRITRVETIVLSGSGKRSAIV